jgi:hypothetical protein
VDEHLMLLDNVLRKLEEANMTINLKKCRFLTAEVMFLGFTITPEGVRKDPSYVEVIHNLSRPRNLKSLRRILGLFRWCSHFVFNFAEKASPLYDLLREKKKWKWTPEHDKSFILLKDELCANVLLVHPDLEKDFCLAVDASTTSTAAILYQLHGKERRIVGFTGKLLKPCESRYTITELELLSIVQAARKWKYLLLGHHVTIYTDHQALVHFRKIKYWNGRLYRWCLELQDLDLEIVYVRGATNFAADALSRVESTKNWQAEINLFQSIPINMQHISLEAWKQAQEEDRSMDAIREALINTPDVQHLSRSKSYSQYYKFEKGVLLKRDFHHESKWRIVVPARLVQAVLYAHHDQRGHFGRVKTHNMVLQNFYWESVYSDVKNHVRDCVECMRHKPNCHPLGKRLEHVQVERPRELLSVDVIGKLPYSGNRYAYVVTCMDVGTRYLTAYPVRNATAMAIIKCLDSYFLHLGVPDAILTDNGPCFTSHKFGRYVKSRNIKLYHTTPYHPKANPVERAHREINRI